MRYRLFLAALASLAFACAERGPHTESDFDAFVGSLEQEADTGVFLVDGDLAVDSDKRLREVFEAMRAGERPDLMAGSAGWGPERRHQLSYCVSAELGPARHDAVARAMAEATAEWEEAADVHFQHVSDADGQCSASQRSVWFDVGAVDDVSYLARSFFPTSSRAHRSLRLADAAFDGTLPLRAILTHQLGHALGLPNAGCEAGGVMQDLECAAGELHVADADAARVAELYGPSTHAPHVPSAAVAADVFRVAGVLGAHSQRRLARLAVVPGSTFRASIVGSGDVDLYVGLGAVARPDSYACRPYGPGSDEECELTVPDDVDSVFVTVVGHPTGDAAALELAEYAIEVSYVEQQAPQVTQLELETSQLP